MPAATSLMQCQSSSRIRGALRGHSPLPAAAFPPDVEGAHGCVRKIKRRTRFTWLASGTRATPRRITDLPRLLTPCTMPPVPPRPPISTAMFRKLSTFLYRLLSGLSLRSFPHSQLKMQPLGASSGSGGIGLRMSGSGCVSLSQAPRPLQDEKSWFRNGAFMTPITGSCWTTNPMDTQNMGKRCV